MREDDRRTEYRPGEVIEKTAPEIKLRGMIDSLTAQAILTASYAEHFGYTNVVMGAKDIVRVMEALRQADATGEEPDITTILGFTLDEIRDCVANPKIELGLDPYYPNAETDLMTAHLNVLRTKVREAELAYCAAPDTKLNRAMQRLLNRLSGAVYIVMLECHSERI